MKKQTCVKISRAVLVFAKIAAWFWVLPTLIFMAGDPVAPRTPAQIDNYNQRGTLIFSCFAVTWLVVIAASLWHRRVRAIWLRENADVWLAAYGVEPGTR